MVTTKFNRIIVLLLALLIIVSITRTILETKSASLGFLYSLDERGTGSIYDIVLVNDDDNHDGNDDDNYQQNNTNNMNMVFIGMKAKQYQNSSSPVTSALLEEYFGKVPSVIIAGTQKGVSFFGNMITVRHGLQ